MSIESHPLYPVLQAFERMNASADRINQSLGKLNTQLDQALQWQADTKAFNDRHAHRVAATQLED